MCAYITLAAPRRAPGGASAAAARAPGCRLKASLIVMNPVGVIGLQGSVFFKVFGWVPVWHPGLLLCLLGAKCLAPGKFL